MKMVAAVAEWRVEDRYGRTLENLREERDFYKQHNESLMQQIIEAQTIQSKMQERYGRDANRLSMQLSPRLASARLSYSPT